MMNLRKLAEKYEGLGVPSGELDADLWSIGAGLRDALKWGTVATWAANLERYGRELEQWAGELDTYSGTAWPPAAEHTRKRALVYKRAVGLIRLYAQREGVRA